MADVLSVTGVDAGYGQAQVLRGLSFSVGEGESVGLTGPNGHGKTTALRCISGLHKVDHGEVIFKGVNITHMSPKAIVSLGLIHVSQSNPLFPGMKVAEVLRLGAYCRRARRDATQTLSEVLELFPRLAERRRQTCSTLSGGERQMLAIAAGLMARPDLLMLDEPTLGLAPLIKINIAAQIRRISETGTSIVLVDGDLRFLTDLTNRWYMVEEGAVTRTGNSSDHAQTSALAKTYLTGASSTREGEL